MASQPEISIVIPAYNEALRLPPYLAEWLHFLPQHFASYEVIIADDGSTDNLRTIAVGEPDFSQHVIYLALPHAGKGAAVKAGMLRARGEWRLFADADGATPVAELLALCRCLVSGEEGVVIGSRVALEGTTKVERQLLRHYLGRVFATITSLLSGLSIYDTQCGFKLFTAGAAERLFSPLQTEGFAFDVELLMRAKRLGLAVHEVPISWRDQAGSKVRLFRDALRMLSEVWRLRWILARE